MPKSILKSILVSIDRSSDSTPAMELALGWARRFEAELVGVGFIDEYSIEVAQEYLYKEGLIAEREPAADRPGPAGLPARAGAVRRPLRARPA